MASPTGYYILYKPKKLYHVYDMNKCVEYGDNENLYNPIPICNTANVSLYGTIHNLHFVKIEYIKNIIIDIFKEQYNDYNDFCRNCASKIFIESRSKLLKYRMNQESVNYDNQVLFSEEEYDYILKFIRENLQTE